MTSLTPRRPRSASERRKLFQNASASEGPVATPSTSRRPIGVDADSDYHRPRDDAPGLSRFDVGGVDPEIGPFALDRAGEEGIHALVDLLDKATDLALGDAGGAHRADQVIDRAGGDAMDVGLLDDRGQGLLRRTPRL